MIDRETSWSRVDRPEREREKEGETCLRERVCLSVYSVPVYSLPSYLGVSVYSVYSVSSVLYSLFSTVVVATPAHLHIHFATHCRSIHFSGGAILKPRREETPPEDKTVWIYSEIAVFRSLQMPRFSLSLLSLLE